MGDMSPSSHGIMGDTSPEFCASVHGDTSPSARASGWPSPSGRGTTDMTKVGIILGSTRPGRNGEAVAKWVYDIASRRGDAEFELVDLLDYNLPHLDEAIPPSQGQYANEHTKQWAAKIAEFDAFIFVTPEYNHSTSGALKNAIDFLYAEWNNKAAGFVSYGSV